MEQGEVPPSAYAVDGPSLVEEPELALQLRFPKGPKEYLKQSLAKFLGFSFPELLLSFSSCSSTSSKTSDSIGSVVGPGPVLFVADAAVLSARGNLCLSENGD